MTYAGLWEFPEYVGNQGGKISFMLRAMPPIGDMLGRQHRNRRGLRAISRQTRKLLWAPKTSGLAA